MRGRLTYANVAATLALVFAMSGGALAASHYLIHSTRQISPAVLKKLRGARGATGATGPPGPTGAGGAAGKDGAPGKEGPSAASTIATSFAQATFGGGIALEDTDTLVLRTKTGGKNLVLASGGAHVLAEASVEVENNQVSKLEVICHLAWEGLAGGGPHAFGESSTVDLQGEFVARAEIPLTASVSLVGGETYDLQIICHTGAFESGNGKALAAAINAFGPE